MSIASLSDEEKRKKLEVYDALQAKKLSSSNAVDEFVQNAKSSLLFQYNWDESLNAAPLAINLLGSCYIACSVKSATEVTLPAPLSGTYKYLEHTSLRACMMAMGDMGLNALANMGPKMNSIALESKKINSLVNDVIKALAGGQGAAQFLKITLSNIKNMSKRCSTHAEDVDQKFSDWLAYVQELHAATLAGETNNDIKRAANQTQLLATQAQEGANEKAVKGAQKAMDELGETLTTTREAYKKASDEFPNGWTVIGQQFVAGLGQTLNNALNACIPALVAKINPIAQVGEAVDMYKKATTDPSKTGGTKEDVSATGAPPQQPQLLPADYNDPAYSAVGTVSDVSSVLLAILTSGKDGGVDWATAHPKAGESKKGASYVLSMLEFSQSQFRPSTRPPSEKFSASLREIVQVAKDVKKASEDQSKMGTKEPDEKIIAGWQTTTQNSVNEFTVLKATADSLSKSTPPLINPGELAKSSATSGSIATAILDKASERLNMTQQTMKQTSQDYQKAAQVYTEIAKLQAEIAGELVKLADQEVSLKQVKAVLTKCIECLVQLKAQIRKLVAFFAALATLVEYVEGNEMKLFTDYVEGVIPEDNRSVAGFGLIDLTRQAIFNSALLVRAYFSLFADIALMLVKINSDHLEPGQQILDKVFGEVKDSLPSAKDKSDSPGLVKNIAELKNWTSNATDKISEMAKSTQTELLDGMEKRANDAADTMAQLPPPSEDKLKAIEAGKQVVVDAATQGLTDYKPPATARSFSQTVNLMSSS